MVRGPSRKRIVTTAIAIALSASTLAVAATLTLPVRDLDVVGSAIPAFIVSGHVDGLYPGKVTTLRAKIYNPYSFPIDVRFVRPKVLTVRPACPAGNVIVTRWRGHLTVPPHRRRKVLLAARMRPKAPSACEAVNFPIVFAGRAVKA